MLTPQAMHALSLRGIDAETASRFQVSSLATDKEGDWIEIPYYRNGEQVGLKRRTLTGSLRISYDNRPRVNFWNSDALTDSTLAAEPIVICQDELDAISLLQAGYARTVAIPDLPDSQPKANRFDFLSDSLKLLGSCEEVVLATNSDDHGQRLLNDLAIRVGKTRCKRVVYPLDPTGQSRLQSIADVASEYGDSGIAQCISGAHWLYSDGVYTMSELPPLPEPPVHRLGFSGLDNHFGIRRGDFCVITGVPSHGKSSLLNDIACRMVARHKWRVAFASFEQMPQTDHKRNLRAWFHGQYTAGDPDEWIDNHFRFIVPKDDELPTLEWVLDRYKMAGIQHNCDMLVLDPWNEVDHSRPKDTSLTEYTGYAIKQFKRIARELDVFLVIAAHPAKMRRGDDGNYSPPTLYDISDSAHWANKADIGISVFRPDPEKNHTQIIVNKVRYQNIIGQPGVINTHYLYEQRRYEWTDMR